MKLAKVVELVEAKIVAGSLNDKVVESGFCSDLMSDVLTIDADKLLLITGMTNIQTIRTAEMADILAILLVRNKRVSPEMLELAAENKLVILESPFSMFKAAGVLYAAGLNPVY
ncbi:MAG: DRTGG domain-containing protein [Prolixibacteraceae bacterium]